MFRDRESGSEFEKDFIKRQLQKLMQALRQVLNRAQSAQRMDEAEESLRQAASKALKLDMTHLAAVEVGSCAAILGTGDRIRMYAQVLRAESELLRLRGREQESTDRLRRALRLYDEAARRAPPDEEDLREHGALRSMLES